MYTFCTFLYPFRYAKKYRNQNIHKSIVCSNVGNIIPPRSNKYI